MKTKKTAINAKLTKPMEHAILNHVKPLACDCPTAFFYSQIPCDKEPHNYGGYSSHTFKFADAVYNKTNSGIYALDTDGALLIKTGGTYFATVKVDMPFSANAPFNDGLVSTTIIVETPNGFSPYSTQQMETIWAPLTSELVNSGRAIFHGNAVIHVGDPNYGIGTAGAQQARVYLVLSVDGNIEYTPSIEFTVRN